MGTTLTGTTPQDTYESLIKVADNGPLSATAKFLSDGEGHDSVLALSTARVGIGTASPLNPLFVSVSNAGDYVAFVENTNATDGYGLVARTAHTGTSAYAFAARAGATDVFIVRGDGRVGIGTTAPLSLLDAKVSADRHLLVNFDNTVVTIKAAADSANPEALRLIGDGIRFNSGSTGSGTEIARVTANGLTFNGDTAAANALDDYEEGTWTMGVSFGGASVDVTTSLNTGTYTKVGRQVTVNGLLALTSKGSSSGSAKITGLPFTIGGAVSNFAAASLRIEAIAFANQFQALGGANSTNIELEEVTEAGSNTTLSDADFANNSTIMIGFTYFV